VIVALLRRFGSRAARLPQDVSASPSVSAARRRRPLRPALTLDPALDLVARRTLDARDTARVRRAELELEHPEERAPQRLGPAPRAPFLAPFFAPFFAPSRQSFREATLAPVLEELLCDGDHGRVLRPGSDLLDDVQDALVLADRSDRESVAHEELDRGQLVARLERAEHADVEAKRLRDRHRTTIPEHQQRGPHELRGGGAGDALVRHPRQIDVDHGEVGNEWGQCLAQRVRQLEQVLEAGVDACAPVGQHHRDQRGHSLVAGLLRLVPTELVAEDDQGYARSIRAEVLEENGDEGLDPRDRDAEQ
jgi:hypothetical protein